MYPKLLKQQAKARAKTATRKKRLRLVMVLLLLWAVAENVQPVKAAKSDAGERQRSEVSERHSVESTTKSTPVVKTENAVEREEGEEQVNTTQPAFPDTSEILCGYETPACSSPGQEIEIWCPMSGTEGSENLTFPDDGCIREIHWQVQAPEEHGIVLETEFRNRRDGDKFERYDPTLPSVFPSWVPVYKNRDVQLLAYNDVKGWFKLTAAEQQLHTSRSVSVRYTAIPLSHLPVNVYYDRLADTEYYDCSSPRHVPETLKCDMVQQCIGGEDEPSTCEDPPLDCDLDWIPYDEQCLKIVIGAMNYPPEEQCKVFFSSRLASLVSQSERDLVVNTLKKFGWYESYSVSVALRRVHPVSDKLAHLYRFLWQWGQKGSPIAYQEEVFSKENARAIYHCAALRVEEGTTTLEPASCDPAEVYKYNYVCTKPKRHHIKVQSTGVHLPQVKREPVGIQSKICLDGSLVQKFHPCQDEHTTVSELNLPLFPCRRGEAVHYTLVCDGVEDCDDGSDEAMCSRAHLHVLFGQRFVCENSQIVPTSSKCDGVPGCFDGSDESICSTCRQPRRITYDTLEFLLCPGYGCFPFPYQQFFSCNNYGGTGRYFLTDKAPPVKLDLDGFGMFYGEEMNETHSCPETHFRCSDGYCIPTYLLNNGEQDCFDGKDENVPKDNFTCPGYYRCFVSGSCVHSDYVCDGIPHCPNKDDERYCSLDCPENCLCEGYAFKCLEMFDPKLYIEARYLDLSGVQKPALEDVHFMPFLRFVNLSGCSLNKVTLKDMPLLNVLDLSFNEIGNISQLRLEKLVGLTFLDLSGNHMTSQLSDDFLLFTHAANLVSLKTLILKDIGLETIASDSFAIMEELTTLDLRGNPLRNIEKGVFGGVEKLRIVRADEPRICCDYFQQNIEIEECDVPKDELSSCADLLKSDVFRVVLWVFSVLAIAGNAGVLIYRMFVEKEGTSQTYRILVVNLTLSDLVMGVYFAIIGSADAYFRGEYVSREMEWRMSDLCTAAGFLGLLSSEVSALAICLITLDRFLVIQFPFNYRLRLSKVTATIACGATWIAGFLLAAIPLLQTGWDFYGQNGICLPLPITLRPFAGQHYAFGVFVVFNFVLFLVIGAGQVFIFRSVRNSAQSTLRSDRKKEIAIARRLFLIVFTDFCCWFPVGLMGLLASCGVPIPGLVTVLAAVFVLPLNSAVNPYLYTLNTMLERRANRKMRKHIERLMSRLREEVSSWPAENVEELVDYFTKTVLSKRGRSMRATQHLGEKPGSSGSTTGVASI